MPADRDNVPLNGIDIFHVFRRFGSGIEHLYVGVIHMTFEWELCQTVGWVDFYKNFCQEAPATVREWAFT